MNRIIMIDANNYENVWWWWWWWWWIDDNVDVDDDDADDDDDDANIDDNVEDLDDYNDEIGDDKYKATPFWRITCLPLTNTASAGEGWGGGGNFLC